MADRPIPYVEKKPNDLLRAGDWNELQVRAREEIQQTHDHSSGSKGLQIPRAGIVDGAVDGSKIDSASAVTVASLSVSAALTVGKVGPGRLGGPGTAVDRVDTNTQLRLGGNAQIDGDTKIDGALGVRGNVAIGTASPENTEGWSKVLDVLGSNHAKLSVRTSGASIDGRVQSHDTGFWGSLPGLVIGTKSAHALSFGTNAQVRMTVDSGGNVGVGTTSPISALQVKGTLTAGTGGNNAGAVGSVQLTGNAGSPVSGRLAFGTDGTGWQLRFGKNQGGSLTDILTLHDNTNVGIGTIQPAARLSITANGAADLVGSVRSQALLVSAGTLGQAAGSELVLASFGFASANNSYLGIRALRTAAGGGWPTTAIGLCMDVDNTVRAADASLWLSATANVGIGTSTPQDKLDVYGAARVLSGSNPIRFTSGWSGFPDAVTNQAEISNDTVGYKTLMIVGNKSGGNGIRRVGVWDRLDVNGNMQVTGRIGTNGYSPDSGFPTNKWGGGVHTWDLICEASGFAKNGFSTQSWDLAEQFALHEPELEAGDVVAIDSAVPERLVRSSQPCQETVLGVISEKPGFLLGVQWEDPDQGVPLALAGRVPVKVTLEGGPIRIGDYLCSASEPGHAMRAVCSCRVIGMALSAFDGAEAPSGKVIVFVNPHRWNGP